MQHKIMFLGSEVRALVEHARNADLHIPTYEDCRAALGDEWVKGNIHIDAEHELARDTPPALHLVRDHGIYLMSNGWNDERSKLIAYGIGFKPPARNDMNRIIRFAQSLRLAAGADAFVIDLPIPGRTLESVFGVPLRDDEAFFVVLEPGPDGTAVTAFGRCPLLTEE